MLKPPKIDLDFDNLPRDPQERHEILLDVFGEYLFWVRGQTLSRARGLAESLEARKQLGTIYRKVYEEAAKLNPQDREVAYGLAEACLDCFSCLFLTMISGTGFEDHIGPNHVFRYRLDMEICDAETGDIVLEETINRNGKKFFPDYWGRWLNRYGVK